MAAPLSSRIKLFLGDISSLDVDAIVTAANEALCGGGGVDGAVHDAAGPELVRASMSLAPCMAGDARITDAFDLPGRFVIHAVGPIFRNLETDAPILANSYRSALSLAAEHHVDAIAFPCISTGVFAFPPDSACNIAIDTVLDWLRSHVYPQSVIFCCFEHQDHALYRERLDELGVLPQFM